MFSTFEEGRRLQRLRRCANNTQDANDSQINQHNTGKTGIVNGRFSKKKKSPLMSAHDYEFGIEAHEREKKKQK